MYFNRGEIREQPSPKKVNVNHVVELKIQKTYTHTETEIDNLHKMPKVVGVVVG